MEYDFANIDKNIAVNIFEKSKSTNKRYFKYLIVHSTNDVICIISFNIAIYEYYLWTFS